MTFTRLLCGLLAIFMCLQWQANADALPLDHSEGKAESHEHWEHIVKRRSADSLYEPHEIDEASHIVNVQDYYRETFEQGWNGYRDHEKDLFNLLSTLETVVSQDEPLTKKEKVSIQEQTAHVLEFSIHSKPIRGRYMVMLEPNADDYILDRTIEVLTKANKDSEQRVRASDIHTLRHVGKGFVATLNSKTVNLVSWYSFGHEYLYTI